MSHPSQQEFCRAIKQMYPDRFINKRVLDVGSLNINGSNKDLFEGGEYLGLDIAPGRNVDIVSICHEYQAPNDSFDTIISTNAFEHDKYLDKTLQNIVRMLKPGGFFIFSCAGIGWPEHGTNKADQGSSPFTIAIDDWKEYYKNVSAQDVRAAIDVDAIFSEYKFETYNLDFRFYGTKRRDAMKLDNRFFRLQATPMNIHEHMEYLKNSVISGQDIVVELGVETGVSSTAFAMGKPKKHIAIDIKRRNEFNDLLDCAKEAGLDLTYQIDDDLTIQIPECDILFIDSWHTYTQLKKELELHGNKARRLMIFHDTTTFGERGEDGKMPALNAAITEFLSTNLHWKVKQVFTNCNGLTVLERTRP